MKFSALLTVLAAGAVTADGPTQGGNTNAVHRVHMDNFGPEIPATFDTKTKRALDELSFTARRPLSDDMIAAGYLMDKLPTEYVISSKYKTKKNGVTHYYLRQMYKGLEVLNGDASLHLNEKGEIVSFSESFYRPAAELVQNNDDDTVGVISASDALRKVAEKVGIEGAAAMGRFDEDQINFGSRERKTLIGDVSFAKGKVPAKLAYIQTAEGLKLTWDLEVDMGENWYSSSVNAKSGEVIQMIDWVSNYVDDSSYRAYPIGVNDPHDGERVLLDNPANLKASPLGWHDQGKAGKKHKSTVGNNVWAQLNPSGDGQWEKNSRPENENLSFDYPIDLAKEPKDYANAAVTNLFVWNNFIHDILYQYGFNEEAGNFQEDNFGNGGRGNDAVIANAQDGSGYSNANFATPPDGQKGRMRMYIWNGVKPMRDGDLEAGIIIHEYLHGVSNRLTGGPSNVNCLGMGESGGMGEGWGDALSLFFRWRPEYGRKKEFGMGLYSATRNIRRYDYSENTNTNPHDYSYIANPMYRQVHKAGEVWAVTLYEAFLNFVEEHGFDADWYNGKGGNNMLLQDIIDGMKLQPCRPSFVDARDAIIKADEINYGGQNKCLLWRAFAKRGLGVNAKSGGKSDKNLPKECAQSRRM